MKSSLVFFVILFIIMFLLTPLFSQTEVTGELIFKLHNMPGHDFTFSIRALDHVFDKNKLYTTHLQGGVHTIPGYATEINIDFAGDPDNNVDSVGYSLYEVVIDNDRFWIDYRDCNYPYPDSIAFWDITFHYYYDTGQIIYRKGSLSVDFSGETFPVWFTRPDFDWYEPDTSCFRPAVLLANLYNDQSFDSLEVDDHLMVPSGTYVRFDSATTHFVNPRLQQYLEGAGIPDKNIQHHDWNEMASDYLYQKVFQVIGWKMEQKAWFYDLSPCTLKTEMLSGGSGIPIAFKDPWLLEPDGTQPGWFHTYPFPYVPANGYGLFLDQDFQTSPVYYTVRAPQDTTISFHGEDITWYFQGWSGTDVEFEHPDQNQTAVVFRQANAVARAEYKGHLASSSDKATAYNNARNLVKDAAGIWHLVYEDHGQI